jgi:hypothetical protein
MTGASRARGSPSASDAGAVTVEAAIALCGFIAVLAMVLAGLSAVLDQIWCTDAAGEAARLAARGDMARARQVATSVAPSGAKVTVIEQGDTVTVEIAADPVGGLLPGVRVRARAVVVREPDPLGEPPVPTPPATTATSTPTTTSTPTASTTPSRRAGGGRR